MSFIMENWPLILAALAVLAAAGFGLARFFALPTHEQLEKVRGWLLYAVAQAERELGGGTGALKLRRVYDAFAARFPWMVKVVSWDQFCFMVDEALEELKGLLAGNEDVRELVKGGKAG